MRHVFTKTERIAIAQDFLQGRLYWASQTTGKERKRWLALAAKSREKILAIRRGEA